jgi:chemotaxis protein MotB
MRSRPFTQRPHRDRWMVSYLDVLTILLIFFLTAAAKGRKAAPSDLASASAEQGRDAKPAASRARKTALAAPTPQAASTKPAASSIPSAEPDAPSGPRASAPPDVSPPVVPDPALAGLARNLRNQGLDVRNSAELDDGEHPGERGLTILLPQAVLFSPGDDRIHDAARAPLRIIAAALRDLPNKVNLAGHADATPIHNRRFANNWELAAARSLRLMEVLTERFGIDDTRVSISSYGAQEPNRSNDTKDGRASNRRVEIRILSGRP